MRLQSRIRVLRDQGGCLERGLQALAYSAKVTPLTLGSPFGKEIVGDLRRRPEGGEGALHLWPHSCLDPVDLCSGEE